MNKSKNFILFIFLFLYIFAVHAQDIEQLKESPSITWNGGITWSNVFKSRNDSLQQNLQYTHYITGSLNTTIFGIISVPISFAYTNDRLSKTITNPFNRFSFAPSWRWIKLHVGYSQMTFSSYTMVGREFMGAGIELTPYEIPWTFSAFFGRFNKASLCDSIITEPVYKRMGGGIMCGYKGERFTLSTNVVICKDDVNSLSFTEGVDTTYIAPQGNIAGSVCATIKPSDKTTIDGEYAISIINSNCKTDTLGHVDGFGGENTDIARHTAGKLSVTQSFGNSSIGATYERVSPLYKSFASYYNTNNFENIMANFATSILQVITLNANVGWQHDNLNNQEINTNSQLIYSANTNIGLSEKLSFSGSISNVQSYVHIKNILEQITQTTQYQNLDTLSFTELSFNASTSVNYRFGDNENFTHNVSGNYSYQKASNIQENSQQFVNNRIHNINTNYQVLYSPIKLSSTLSINYNINKTPEYEGNVLTFTASAGMPIIQKIKTNLSVNYSKINVQTNYYVLNTKLAVSYSFLNHHTLNCSITALNNGSEDCKTQYTANITYNLSLDYKTKQLSEKRKNV